MIYLLLFKELKIMSKRYALLLKVYNLAKLHRNSLMLKESLEKLESITRILRNLTMTITIPWLLFLSFFELESYLSYKKERLDQQLKNEQTISQKAINKWNEFYLNQKKKSDDKIEIIKERLLKKVLESFNK